MNSEKRLIRIVTWAGAGVVLLHLLFAFWRVPTGWGVNALAFFPSWAAVGATALALLLLLPGVPARVAGALSRLRTPEGIRRRHLRCGAVSLLSLIPFYLFRVRVQTLGDGPIWIRELTAPPARLASEPLTIALVRVAYGLTGGAGEADALRVYQVMSWACGALYVFLALLTADAMGRDARERGIVRLSLLTVGTMELFCGYAEHYAPLTVAILTFLYLSWRYLDGHVALIWPALVSGVACVLHFSALALLPALAFLCFIARRRDPSWTGLALKLAILPALLIAAFMSIRRYLGLNPVPPGTESHLVPLWAPDPFLHPNTLLSPVHVADVINLHLLAAPMGLLLVGATLFTLRDRAARSPHLILLGASAFCHVMLTAVFNPEIGAFRDWDLASPAAVPVVLLGAYLLTRCAEPGTQGRVAWVLGVVALFHLLPWLWVNADGERALARYVATLRDGSRLSVHARGSGYDELRGMYERLGRKREALDAETTAFEVHPRHPRYLANVVRLMDEVGSREELESLLKGVVARDPKFADARMDLAALYQRSGRFSESEQEYREALTADPRNADLHTGLGLLLYTIGRMAEGAEHFNLAVQLDGRDPVPYAKLGIYYQEIGQVDRSLDAFRRAVALKPDYAEARVNLGIALYRAGRLDEGEMEFVLILRAEPDNGPAKNALAMIYKDRGRLDDAVRLLQEVIEKDPGNRNTLTNLSSLCFVKGDLEGAARTCERLMEIDPKDERTLLNLCAIYSRLGNADRLAKWERRYAELKKENGMVGK